jgi:integrating conjugative element relaxase (TIGR03760 family)
MPWSNMFGKSAKAGDTPAPPPNFEILAAPKLLSVENRSRLLADLPSLVCVRDRNFNVFYLKAIYNFAEFVQNLPETKSSFYSHEGGLLDHALDRAYRALILTRAYLLPAGALAETVSETEALWIYAVFTASLLLDVGKVPVRFTVHLCNQKGETLTQWRPYDGSMLNVENVSRYRYEFEVERNDRLRRLSTLILACDLLPKEGFAWLSSNKEILEAWLALFDEDQSGGGLLLQIIPLVDAQLIEWQLFGDEQREIPYAKELPINPLEVPVEKGKEETPADKLFAHKTYTGTPLIAGTGYPTVASAASTTVLGSVGLSAVERTLPAGIAFLKWLRQSVLSGKIVVNGANSPVHRVAEGVLLLPKVFTDFAKQNSQFKDIHTIAQQFAMIELGGKQQAFRQSPTDSTARIFTNGIIVTDVFNILPAQEKMPGLSDSVVPLVYPVTSVPSAVLTHAAVSQTSNVVQPPTISPSKP